MLSSSLAWERVLRVQCPGRACVGSAGRWVGSGPQQGILSLSQFVCGWEAKLPGSSRAEELRYGLPAAPRAGGRVGRAPQVRQGGLLGAHHMPAQLPPSTGCTAPMVYLDCSNASAGTPGAECLRSCHTLDVDCVSGRRGRAVPLGPRAQGRAGADAVPIHSSAPTAYLAACAPRGWCRTGAGVAWPRRTARVCTTKLPTSPGRPSGSPATPGGSGLLCRR